MEDKKPLVVGIVGVIVVIVIALIAVSLKQGSTVSPRTGGVEVKGEDTFRPENENALGTVEGGTREKVQEKIATPEEGDTATPANVAVPTTVVDTGKSSFRHFDIAVTGNNYNPSTIVVNEGDVIDISLTAEDKDYNIFFPDFGVYKEVIKGQTGKLQFQGYPFGQYKFVCDECTPSFEGKLIVNEK
ncbi:MAG: cupredoxin domain-containing protein [Patescibacteria group bacterium]|nr:cupredoxin domain-containing protein [Patescibacteria group bacterium]